MKSGGPFYGDGSPIAAAATAPAKSALALLRLSGENTLTLLGALFSRPKRLLEAPGNSVVHGWIRDSSGEGIDEVLVSVYRAPRSFTGEEGADFSCHGGTASVRAVMETLKRGGFREALPGEFTFRAFMNGKLDLTRSESVMELVSARTDRARRHALRRLSGALEEEIRRVKELLVRVLAETELLLDYSEADGIYGTGSEGLPGLSLAEEALDRLRNLAAGYSRERLYQEGALAVIAGRPNAGKSSLFNLLLREERAIVTEFPGTTRDWIEAWISLDGIPLRLADTAGLRPDRKDMDQAELLGIRRSRDLLKTADIVLYVIDGASGITGEDREFLAGAAAEDPAPIVLWNKADLVPPPALSAAAAPEIRMLEISAKTGRGLRELTAAIRNALEKTGGSEDAEGAAPGTLRQKELIDAAAAALTEALNLADQNQSLDLIAPPLREGINALGEITGEVSTAEILETLFSRFCVGK
jgi:tRNA modification GTPase